LPATASEWIAPNLIDNIDDPPGLYEYTMQFYLPAICAANTATISGRWAADNGGLQILLNGHLTTASPTPYPYGHSQWTHFVIAPNPYFVAGGNNTLTFVVTNQFEPGYSCSENLSYTGLRVEFTNAYVCCSTCAPPVISQITAAQSSPPNSQIIFGAVAEGTPPFTYQWYRNTQPLAGATSSGLQFPATYADAGLYSVVISSPCGAVTGTVPFNVSAPVGWPIGLWNVQALANPLMATIGPDLNLVGSGETTNYTLTTGTTEDFGLPEEGGQIVNVMHFNPAAPASLQIPLLAPSGSLEVTNYTVIMDIYEPDTSLGVPGTLFATIPCCISNLSSGGQDGLTLTLDATNDLHVIGSIGGMPFEAASSVPLPVDTWNRVALVVNTAQYGGNPIITVSLNGLGVIHTWPCPPCCKTPCCIQPITGGTTNSGTAVNWANASPTVLSAMADAASPNAEFYLSSLQFQAAALTPEAIAGLGSPDNGPAPVNPTSAGSPPVLSATLSNGAVNITWTGSSYVLQETTDLSRGQWTDSSLPFTETESTGGGSITTTAVVTPTSSGPIKFYRLVFRP
jgi:hypothetical protein